MDKKPYALANALRKIDDDPLIEAVHSKDVAQLFIDNHKVKRKIFWMGCLTLIRRSKKEYNC